jgi:putative acetyltransferase
MSATTRIRPERPEDHEAIAALVEHAFGSPDEARLVERIRASDRYVPELALVALVGGEVRGHVMISGAILRTADGDHPIVMLAPLAVAPADQRVGIGGALVREVTRRAAALGYTFVVLEGSPTYYERFGFRPASSYGVTLPLPDWAPPDAAQLLPLAGFRDDALHGGGTVVYPPAFEGVA